MSDIRIGVIGGSGLYEMEGLKVREERRIETPFGDPSDAYVIGELDGRRVAFLPRHGRGHRLLPTELNYRANIFGFKVLGVEQIISVSAVGSLKIEYKPTDIVVPDQFFDRTRHRADTFFGNGLVAHVSLAKPICPRLIDPFVRGGRAPPAPRSTAAAPTSAWKGRSSRPAPSPRPTASMGIDIIGMTNLQEARLAREAEICYATPLHGHRLRLLARDGGGGLRRGGHGGRAARTSRCRRRWCARSSSGAAGERPARLPLRARRSSTR